MEPKLCGFLPSHVFVAPLVISWCPFSSFCLSPAPSSPIYLSISESDSYISTAISTKGLSFAKVLLISQAVDLFASIRIRGIEKSIQIPFVGEVYMTISNLFMGADNCTQELVPKKIPNS
jgi:hypothetical protein